MEKAFLMLLLIRLYTHIQFRLKQLQSSLATTDCINHVPGSNNEMQESACCMPSYLYTPRTCNCRSNNTLKSWM